MKITVRDIDCRNVEYLDSANVDVKEEDTKWTLNITSNIIKEIPEDAICETKFYRMVDQEWKKSSYHITPGPCCKIFVDNEFYQKFAENQMVPKECPIKPGFYGIQNFVADYADKCDDAPRGEFKAVFTATADPGGCLLQFQVGFKITDKE
ncbi:hypothetical protein C0J52_02535 [Blattella germanica]|nr:hypothetical protein C0J52_02535 [Blattella germanica]